MVVARVVRHLLRLLRHGRSWTDLVVVGNVEVVKFVEMEVKIGLATESSVAVITME